MATKILLVCLLWLSHFYAILTCDGDELHLSSHHLCVYDSLQINISTSHHPLDLEIYKVPADHLELAQPSSLISIYRTVLSLPIADTPCSRLFVDTSICQRLTLEQDLLSSSVENSSVIIKFKYDTNLPLIHDYDDFRQYITLSPLFLMNHEFFTAFWISPAQLQIVIDKDNTYPVHEANISWSEEMLHQRNRFSRNLKFSEIGQYQIKLKDHDTHQVLVSSDPIHVSLCSADIVIPKVSNIQAMPSKSLSQQVTPQREFRIRGPLALSGHETVQVGHKSLKSLQSDNFSLSFWIRLMEPPNGKFRTIFFKGDTSGQRHPSMWLLPNANRFTIRTSTIIDVDVGAESKIDIPLNKWCFIALNFENNSFILDPNNPHSYAITLFVNDMKDTTFLFKVCFL